jgi:hypothetical protein
MFPVACRDRRELPRFAARNDNARTMLGIPDGDAQLVNFG